MLKLLLKYTQATFLILFPVFFFFSCRVVKRNKELKRFKNLRLLFQTNFTAQKQSLPPCSVFHVAFKAQPSIKGNIFSLYTGCIEITCSVSLGINVLQCAMRQQASFTTSGLCHFNISTF